jgi:SAM-dependent methyltransferase
VCAVRQVARRTTPVHLMSDTPDQLHPRFAQQARWTAAIRQRAFGRFGLGSARRVLEVGSGTGAITSELQRGSRGRVVGLDRDRRSNAFATGRDAATCFVTGLAERLPFPPASFDLACCHFLLLWVDDPSVVLDEMRRVTAPGGAVLCLAEPDYGGRIDYPDSLALLGRSQEAALRRQGAETRLGRRLRHLLHQAGLTQVETGVLGGEWQSATEARSDAERELEWQTLARDLQGELPAEEQASLREELMCARQQGSHVLFVPTFYGWGTCPPVP